MVSIKNEYKSFLDDIEKNIKNKEDLEYIKKRFADFLEVVIEKMDYILDYKEEEMNKLEEKQNQIEAKISSMQKMIDNIENDKMIFIQKMDMILKLLALTVIMNL